MFIFIKEKNHPPTYFVTSKILRCGVISILIDIKTEFNNTQQPQSFSIGLSIKLNNKVFIYTY